MKYISYYKTSDGSTGLYNDEMKEIFHSKTGALKEANEKFINPLLSSEVFLSNDKIKILDLCTGAGYNLKAAIKGLNNKKLYFDCIEKEIKFVYLSPFINDGINDAELNLKILSELLNKGCNLSEMIRFIFEECSTGNEEFFSASMIKFIKFLSDRGYINRGSTLNNSFLHNIYYNYISESMYNDSNINKYANIKINYEINDARQFIKTTKHKYDVVFLDAFSPQKDPILWTIDFISEIKKHLNNNSLILSYSKSTPFRSALVNLGFTVGKIINDNDQIGTVASLNSKNIINNLSDYDKNLLSTTAGIVYTDSNLSDCSQSILKRRDDSIKTSKLMSHTQFLKKYKL